MMLYTGREPNPRMGEPLRAPAEERRTYSRRIDCCDAGRRTEIQSATPGVQRDARQAPGRRAMDID
jgi:hypothetical protein